MSESAGVLELSMSLGEGPTEPFARGLFGQVAQPFASMVLKQRS